MINNIKRKTLELLSKIKHSPYKNLVYSVGINIIVLLSLCLIGNPVFETNDDNAMAFIAEGIYGSRYSRLVFINVLLGKTLKILYTILPFVKWYSIIQYFFMFISFTSLTYILLQKRRTKKIYDIILACFLCLAGYECYVKVAFTKTAALCSIVGYLLLFFYLRSGKKHRFIIGGVIFGSFLLFSGSLIRFYSFLMVSGFMLGLGLWEILCLFRESVDTRKLVKKLGYYFLLFGSLFLCIFSARYLDRSMYTVTPNWQDYMQFNDMRAKVMDHKVLNYELYQTDYEALHVSQNDITMWSEWNIADYELFDQELMGNLLDIKTKQADLKQVASDIATKFPFYYMKDSLFLLIAFMIGYYILYYRKGTFLLCFTMGIWFLFSVYLIYNDRFGQHRVDIIFAFAIIGVLLGGLISDKTENTRMLDNKAVILFTALLLASGFDIIASNIFNNPLPYKTKQLEKDFFDEVSSDTENLYMVAGGSGGLNKVFGVFDPAPHGYSSNIYSLGGWSTHSPFTNEILYRYQITNPIRDLINDNVYLIDNYSMPIKYQYLVEHYYEGLDIALVKDVGGYQVYKFFAPGFSLDNRPTYAKDKTIHSEMDISLNGSECSVTGYVYKQNTNSFGQNIYLKVSNLSTGESFTNYATQRETADSGGADRYANFTYSTVLPSTAPAGDSYLIECVAKIEDTYYLVDSKTFVYS